MWWRVLFWQGCFMPGLCFWMKGSLCVLLFLAGYSALRYAREVRVMSCLETRQQAAISQVGAFRPDIQRQNMSGRGSSSGTKLGKAELGLGLCPLKFPGTLYFYFVLTPVPFLRFRREKNRHGKLSFLLLLLPAEALTSLPCGQGCVHTSSQSSSVCLS